MAKIKVFECPRCRCFYLDFPVCPNCGYEAEDLEPIEEIDSDD